MEEVKSPRNKLDIEVNVETDEAEVKLERLKKAAEGCTKAFEELGDAIASVGALIQIPEVEDHIDFFNKDMVNV
ncbi:MULTISPECIES: hypothetical protein [Bacillus cereus group]|uniref:hypothetical protein n=1 Tax=Bacillus cereus group TaxID=86661 RepID=UPI0022B72598|nr:MULTISPECIES: hypothetical protein [Bacillus cereus group]MCZ7524324.1 hypothetical protein [Bacillus pacificus]MED1612553.1 hypothetical protein [Bacillus paranthracis]MED1683492.1 hypothetical protein [Bacillus paranthracis]